MKKSHCWVQREPHGAVYNKDTYLKGEELAVSSEHFISLIIIPNYVNNKYLYQGSNEIN